MDKLRSKFQSLSSDALPSQRCFRRFMDLELLKTDLADDKSLINKKLTPEERAAVLKEKNLLAWGCVYTKPSSAPYLYLQQ
eukprot:CAMPEP_0185582926 /NCGR_PEP_ID=MMETSP0434-20130131/21217_1 /TAXON_ID=626734 ORGANISM="Favella taraikaensis, Strain Fe Narragansett Bay" /NCGR_SAMPLE_ID=MMETSP0434 /ASSEMBLY_ACC=CAM_ASM_000379 /LENGTH=80 /DNA_ID=CAMNT_0028201891 /DNA_START=23 /DNA_END=265 /DNA_ORIENTATION=+